MRKSIALLAIFSVLAVVAAITVYAAETSVPPKSTEYPENATCGSGPSAGEMAAAREGQGQGMAKEARPMNEEEMMGQRKEMMKKSGMSEGMVMRDRMLIHAKIEKDNPSGILALKKDLDLDDAQVKKLEKIDEKARKDADKVLTKEQREKLAMLEGTPDSMAGMWSKMRFMRGEEKMEKGEMKKGEWKGEEKKGEEKTTSQGSTGDVDTMVGCGAMGSTASK